jgi:bifunctional non-homologous end joining protein LigD
MEDARIPEAIEPMLATSDNGVLPDSPRYCYEYKWDGYRAIMRVAKDGGTALTSRRGNDFTRTYPELLGVAAPALAGRPAVLDGEIVALDQDGRPDFELLQNRTRHRQPVHYFAFDVLWLDGDSLLNVPFMQRRQLLEELDLADGRSISVPPSYSHEQLAADGLTPADLLGIASDLRLEGLMVKAEDSRYYPGRRSPEWLKHPLVHTQEVIVCGWRPGQGRRSGLLGSLPLGAHDAETGELKYLGDVGTGFTEQMLRDLQEKLAPLARKTAPFDTAIPRDRARGANWVEPSVVGEVVYRHITPGEGRLRHTAWRGLRPDKLPDEITQGP